MNLYQKARQYFSYTPEPSEEKASAVGPLIVMNQLDRPAPKMRNSDDFAKDGYQKTVVAYACINLIADAISSLEWQLFDSKRKGDRNEITDHAILDLLDNPNPMQGGSDFFKAYIAYLMIAGDSYIEGVAPSDRQPPNELWTHRPSRFSVVPGAFGLPAGYEFDVNGRKKTFEVDQVTGQSSISQLSLFNPLSDWYGQTPLEASATDIDQLNGLNVWNLALINNSGRPSGAFIQREGMMFTDQQKDELKDDIDRVMAGGKNAGRPIILQGMDWKEMSLTPKDMDFVKSKETSKADVALAFGVPGQMVGIESSMKFKNMEEAKLHFWNHTAIPLADLVISKLNSWLTPSFGERLFIDYDKNAIDALEPQRAKRWEKAQSSDFLTTNEKREMVGKPIYEPTGDPGDQILVGQGMIPLEEAVIGLDDNGDANEDDDSEDGKSKKIVRGDTIIEGKLFNVNTEAGKRKAWKAATKKRSIFERRTNAQTIAAFNKERKNILSNIKGIDPELMAMVSEESIDQTSEIFEKVLRLNIKATTVSFGKDVLQLGKSQYIHDEEFKVTDDEFAEFVTLFVETEALAATKRITDTTKKKIRKAINQGIEEGESEAEITKRVEATHKSFTRARARTIARTEVHTASNEGSRKAAKTLNVDLMKEWVSDLQQSARGQKPEDITDHIHMNGIKVKLDEKFEVIRKDGSNDSMDGPGDPDAPADQKINCKCTQVYQRA